jgi:endogenous inhibitor of DNA gyrase (YacG/DUF329 family)
MKSIPCPTCKKASSMPADNPSFPFCCAKCQLLDLGRWMDGEYALNPATGALEVIDPETAEVVEFEH